MNNHPMITKAKQSIHKPKTFLPTNVDSIKIEPTFVKRALASPSWFEFMQHEFNALVKNKI